MKKLNKQFMHAVVGSGIVDKWFDRWVEGYTMQIEGARLEAPRIFASKSFGLGRSTGLLLGNPLEYLRHFKGVWLAMAVTTN